MFPVAPATESIASTSGTPATDMVSSVRAYLAMADLVDISPIIGTLRVILSTIFRKLADLACMCL